MVLLLVPAKRREIHGENGLGNFKEASQMDKNGYRYFLGK
jgi:hypothetical protein